MYPAFSNPGSCKAESTHGGLVARLDRVQQLRFRPGLAVYLRFGLRVRDGLRGEGDRQAEMPGHDPASPRHAPQGTDPLNGPSRLQMTHRCPSTHRCPTRHSDRGSSTPPARPVLSTKLSNSTPM